LFDLEIQVGNRPTPNCRVWRRQFAHEIEEFVHFFAFRMIFF